VDFYRRKINHPKLETLEIELTTTLLDSPKNTVFLIVGPSGAGKSTLREKIEHNIRLALAEQLIEDTERLALVSVEAPSPESGIFNWREHFKLMLEEFNEPLIDLKKDSVERRIGPHVAVLAGDNVRVSSAAYRTSVEKAIKRRRPLAVFIDEAQHLAKVSRGKRLQDQLDVVKSIANRTKTPHILVGPYELLRLRNLSGQLSRRSIDFHFPRYRANVDEDVVAFRNVIRQFARIMPFPESPDLVQEWDYLYERSIGCVGILKDWLTRALAKALRQKAQTITHDDLKKTQMDISKLNQLLTECIEGELYLQESEDDRNKLRIRMGLDKQGGVKDSAPKPPKPSKKKQKPGSRNPTRDKVGTKNAAIG
jgi:energy-coupling factor transporter ATP-binding protein EcfA2